MSIVSAEENISSDTTQEKLVDHNIVKKELIHEEQIKEENNNIILNTNTFNKYVTDGKFNDNVTGGDNVDIQGKLDGSKFTLNVNKPVNIISSTHDAYIDFHTSSYHSYGESNGGIFQVTKEGSGTNITGITIHNTRLSLENTSNVNINNITFLDDGANIGFGVGAVSVREGSENITIANSYFKTRGNGGHSNVVFAAAYNCLFENNTIEGYGDEGLIGNLLYLTTYNVKYATPASNINITIRNNTIRSYYTYGYGTCYGLALEGTGHIIENNIIDTAIPVRAQYAEETYDFETHLGNIIFNNNTITHSDYNNYGSEGFPAELRFPGIISNNTFINHGATINQAYAYNNKFYTVTISNNTKFENNTAQKLNVNGNNNILNNNEVYSDEDYAVIVNGDNNTLENNKFSSVNGRGEQAISNSSEIVSINNSEDIPRIIVITDDNYDDYIEDKKSGSAYLKPVFNDGDIIVFNSSRLDSKNVIDENVFNAGISNYTISNSFGLFGIETYVTYLTVENCVLPISLTYLGMEYEQEITVINSTLVNYDIWGEDWTIKHRFNTTLLIENKEIYILSNFKPTNIYNMNRDGTLKSNIKDNSNLLLIRYANDSFQYNQYSENVYLDRVLNIEGFPGLGEMNATVHFREGSQNTTVSGVTFNRGIVFDVGNIKFINCTFNEDLNINQSNINFNGCIFNSNIVFNESNNVVLNNSVIASENTINFYNSNLNILENNTVNTKTNNTLIFDDSSRGNVVRYNILVSNSSFGDFSVIGGYNTVEDNGPAYDTEITFNDSLFVDDVPEIKITVTDIINNMKVTKGYVEIYYDGILVDKKDLINGETTVTIEPIFGNYPLKVWYYEGVRYADTNSMHLLSVIKSNVTITFDELTAKLNEKATVTATFLNQKGNPIRDTNVTFTVGRSSYTLETVDGVATLNEMVTKEWLDAGKIAVSFPSTDAYNANSTTITLNTSKADVLMVPMVSVDGNAADVELTLSDALGQNVSDGKIVLSTLDGQELASGRVSNGKFVSNVALPEGYSDEYLVANYTGSYYYNDFVRNVKITQMLNSTISLNTNSPLYGEELVITGRLVDSKNTPIGGANLTLNLNGSKVIVTTNDDGEYNYTYTPGLGVNSLTVTFDGTVDVYGSSASKDVTIRDTDREMNEVLNRLDDLQKENEKLQEQNNKTNEQLDNITQANNELKEQLDNLTKDNNDLSKQLNDTKNNLTQQNNDLQEQNKELNDKLDNTAKNLTDANKALQEQNKDAQKQLDSLSKANGELKEQLNNTTNDLAKSNNDLKEQITDLKDQNKALQDQNKQLNDKLDAILKQLEDSVAKNTVITINNVPSARFGQNVTITGKLSDCDGNVIASSHVTVNVGGSAQKVTTDNNGVYTLTVKASVVGDNSVVVFFDANNKYNYAENTTTFKVTRQNLVLKLDSIKAVYYGDKVQITGVLSDANGKLIANTLLNLDINGKTVKVKTVAGGKFTYTVAAKTVGTNNVTVSYNGNKNYNSVSAKKTFKVYKQGLKITVNKITSTKYKNTVKVTGKLTDANGKVIMNTLVTININGKAYTAKTNNKGVYTLTLKATSIGVNNVIVSYKGNKNYKKATVKTSFKVVKQNVKVTLTGSSYSNAKATITGKLLDANNKVLMNSNVKITINNKTYNAKTNTEGTYTLTKPVTSKKITLTLAYNGNKNYNAYKKTSNVTLA